jgi:menaquinol-cytochrome c reductase iron-sulfur subunit
MPASEDLPAPARRSVLVGAIYAMWGAIAAALGAPAFVYLFFPPKTPKADPWVEAGDVSALAGGRPVELVFRRNRIDGWKINSQRDTAWVVRGSGGQTTAFGPQCTHLGCAYHWDDARNEFVCPCHNSRFGLDGQVLAGPATRPLDRYETKIQGGKLLLGRLRSAAERAL